MKLMMQKLCWIGLILCASGTAWAAKGGDDDDKPASNAKKKSHSDDADTDTKKSSSDNADADDDSAKDEGDADEAPKAEPKPKKHVDKEQAPKASKSKSPLDLAALLGYGTSPFTRFGFGLRGGLTLGGREGPYVGILGTFFIGSSVTQDRLTGQAERTRKVIVLAAEGGYDTYLSTDLLARPYLSLGMAMASDHECAIGSCWDNNGVKLAIAPGAQVVYTMGSFFLGGDLRYQIILNESDASAAVISIVAGLSL